MSAYRLSWTQQGRRHGRDYPSRAAAEDASWLLAQNYAVKDVCVGEVPPGEEPDFSGPRPLTGPVGAPLLDPNAWGGGKLS